MWNVKGDILRHIHGSCEINLMNKRNSPLEQTTHIQKNQTNFHSQYQLIAIIYLMAEFA